MRSGEERSNELRRTCVLAIRRSTNTTHTFLLASLVARRALNPSAKTPVFTAAITVTPGYDTSRVFELDRFKFPYNPLMNFFVKSHFVEKNIDVLEPFSSSAYHDSLNASNLQDFLDAAAPFAGYPNASAYYAGENPVNDLHYISTPVFVMNSLDDPCCAIGNFYEKSPFAQHDGRSFAGIVNDSQRGEERKPPRGSKR